MMADTEIMQTRFDQFRRQFSVRSRNRHDSTTSHTGRSTTLVHIDMSCFSAQNTIERTCHSLQSYSVRPRSVKNKKKAMPFHQTLLYFSSSHCPGIVTISYSMVNVRLSRHPSPKANVELLSLAKLHFRLKFESVLNKREHFDTPVYFSHIYF